MLDSHHRSIGLDFVRSMAIILVIVAHYSTDNYLPGLLGVEIFFGLSGFLIGQVLWRNFNSITKWDYKHVVNFWSRRWWRTIPNYLLFLIINIIYNYYSKEPVPSIHELIKFFFFSQNLLSNSYNFYFISWSLCVEEFVYLLFPVVLFFYSRFINSKQAAFITSFLTFFISAPIIRHFLIEHTDYPSIRYLTLGRLDSITYGIAVAYFFVIHPSLGRFKVLAFILGMACFAVPLWLTYFMHINLRDLVGRTYLLIILPLGAALTLPVFSKFALKSKPISNVTIKISLWSYSLYLCHQLILHFITSLVINKVTTGTDGATLYLARVISLVLSVICSWLLFRFFESKFTKMRPKELKPAGVWACMPTGMGNPDVKMMGKYLALAG